MATVSNGILVPANGDGPYGPAISAGSGARSTRASVAASSARRVQMFDRPFEQPSLAFHGMKPTRSGLRRRTMAATGGLYCREPSPNENPQSVLRVCC